MTTLKVAAIQMTSVSDLDANLRHAEHAMQQACAAGARLLLLPENFALYGGQYRRFAEQQGEAVQAWLSHWARTLGVSLIGGTVPLAQRPDGSEVADGKVRASCLAFGPDGQLRARYDKLHLFDVDVADAQGRYCESDVFEPGDGLTVVELEGIQVGLCVCYDLRFAALARALTDRGAELLVYPSAFTEVTGSAHWHLLLRTRAVESGCYVLAADQCGQHSAKRRSYGHSLLADPWGRISAELDTTPDVLCADLDLQRLQEIRASLPLHQHQRLAVTLEEKHHHD